MFHNEENVKLNFSFSFSIRLSPVRTSSKRSDCLEETIFLINQRELESFAQTHETHFSNSRPWWFAWVVEEQSTQIRPYYSYGHPAALLRLRVSFLKRALRALAYSNLTQDPTSDAHPWILQTHLCSPSFGYFHGNKTKALSVVSDSHQVLPKAGNNNFHCVQMYLESHELVIST